MLFADDLQFYIQCKPTDLHIAIAKLNEDAAAVVSWVKENGLVLNVSKTKAILFASVQYHMRIDKAALRPL